jgi:EAL domain-containing protein (putative c-di-GMP-specific phosphodiesterase class I)/PAS domain-containing protein
VTALSATEDRHDMDVPRSAVNLAFTWAGRYLTPFLTAIAVVAVSLTLVCTIYVTQADLQWTAFLLGILVAAVLSLVTQSVKVQWRLTRRTAELRRSRELLTEEIARTGRAAQALKIAEHRYNTVLNAISGMIFFVDREERCRYHNLAFEAWCGRDAADVGRLTLGEIMDGDIYDELAAHGSNALLGSEVQYETYWPFPDGGRHVLVKLLPYPPAAQTTSGFYVFVTRALPARSRETSAGHDLGTPEGAAVYLDAMQEQLPTQSDPREFLLKAIDEDQFLLLEQPIEPLAPDATSSKFREVLLRLREEDERMLRPGGFLEVAEHFGLMPAIDRWVVRRLMRSAAVARDADHMWRMPLYAVNLSEATLGDCGFAHHVRSQLEHWRIEGNRLCFEIDDRVLAERESDVALLMDALKPLGCRFAIDGFGRHKVSFAVFRRLRFDYVKIDGSIVGEILTDKTELGKVRAIVLACQRIGVRTIAQSVEQDAAREKLREIGIDYVQGFGIESPGPLVS